MFIHTAKGKEKSAKKVSGDTGAVTSLEGCAAGGPLTNPAVRLHNCPLHVPERFHKYTHPGIGFLRWTGDLGGKHKWPEGNHGIGLFRKLLGLKREGGAKTF